MANDTWKTDSSESSNEESSETTSDEEVEDLWDMSGKDPWIVSKCGISKKCNFGLSEKRKSTSLNEGNEANSEMMKRGQVMANDTWKTDSSESDDDESSETTPDEEGEDFWNMIGKDLQKKPEGGISKKCNLGLVSEKRNSTLPGKGNEANSGMRKRSQVMANDTWKTDSSESSDDESSETTPDEEGEDFWNMIGKDLQKKPEGGISKKCNFGLVSEKRNSTLPGKGNEANSGMRKRSQVMANDTWKTDSSGSSDDESSETTSDGELEDFEEKIGKDLQENYECDLSKEGYLCLFAKREKITPGKQNDEYGLDMIENSQNSPGGLHEKEDLCPCDSKGCKSLSCEENKGAEDDKQAKGQDNALGLDSGVSERRFVNRGGHQGYSQKKNPSKLKEKRDQEDHLAVASGVQPTERIDHPTGENEFRDSLGMMFFSRPPGNVQEVDDDGVPFDDKTEQSLENLDNQLFEAEKGFEKCAVACSEPSALDHLLQIALQEGYGVMRQREGESRTEGGRPVAFCTEDP